jgi:hypothetical protein
MRKNYKCSEETKRKISLSLKGRHSSPQTEFKKGYISSRKGKKFPQITGKNNGNWKGGTMGDCKGYILILQPSHPNTNHAGYIRRSHLIMEKYLERYLQPEEIVHHINGIKDDDRIENLQLCKNLKVHNNYHPRIHNKFGQFV